MEMSGEDALRRKRSILGLNARPLRAWPVSVPPMFSNHATSYQQESGRTEASECEPMVFIPARPQPAQATAPSWSSRETVPFERHPSWPLPLSGAIASLRTAIAALNRDSVDLVLVRTLLGVGAVPTHLRVSIKEVRVPRRIDVARDLPGFPSQSDTIKEEELTTMPAEWLFYGDEPSLASIISSARARIGLDDEETMTTPTPLDTVERVILYIHGGAYCLLSRKTHRGITWKLAKYAACRVLSIDYRLAPEHTFPLPLQDAISAYSFLVNPPAGQVRYEPGNVIFMGDSAGGGLALATILWLREHGPKYGLEMPGGAGLLSPWLDLSHSMPSFRTNAAFDFLPEKVQDKMLNEERNHYYVKNNSFLQHPLVSPFFSSPDAPLPPLLIQIGECERLRDENLAFALARHASVRLELYEAMVHVFHFFSPVYPFAEVALERLGRFASRVGDGDGLEAGMVRVSCEAPYRETEMTVADVEALLRDVGAGEGGSSGEESDWEMLEGGLEGDVAVAVELDALIVKEWVDINEVD